MADYLSPSVLLDTLLTDFWEMLKAQEHVQQDPKIPNRDSVKIELPSKRDFQGLFYREPNTQNPNMSSTIFGFHKPQ
jgi:hypothetical protein